MLAGLLCARWREALSIVRSLRNPAPPHQVIAWNAVGAERVELELGASAAAPRTLLSFVVRMRLVALLLLNNPQVAPSPSSPCTRN